MNRAIIYKKPLGASDEAYFLTIRVFGLHVLSMLRFPKAYYFDSYVQQPTLPRCLRSCMSVFMQIADETDKYNKFRAAMGK